MSLSLTMPPAGSLQTILSAISRSLPTGELMWMGELAYPELKLPLGSCSVELW